MQPFRSVSRPPRSAPRPWLALAVLALAGACAPRNLVPTEAAPQAAACEPERDRAAILQMAGNYRVEFAFDETVSLGEGYALRAPYRSKASEVVLVLEDSPRRVSLQHLLVMERDGKRSTLKHWRQDWTFEDTELLEFRGHRSWERRELSERDARCTWTQAVFEVDDGPRYEGVGRWTHERGLSAWESRETWRPLPRREYTTREDYHVIVGTNRHALTPTGWVHEQDSLKMVLGDTPHPLARERGTNLYTRQSGEENPAAAKAYWEGNQAFWSEVRQQWSTLFQQNPRFTLREKVEDKPRHDHFFALSAGTPPRAQDIRPTLERFLEPAAK
ncbi:MAG: DUF6607 family protein [Cystobacter sp.]